MGNALFSKAATWTEAEWLQGIFLIVLENRIGSQPAFWHELIRDGKVGLGVVGGVVVTCHSRLVGVSKQAITLID